MQSLHENFIDELIEEAEHAENQQKEAYYDQVLAEIRRLESEISRNFANAEQEVKIINDWALRRNSSLQERIDWLARKLEAFIRERGLKTIDMPNGTLRIRKSPDKLEVTDLDAFLEAATADMLAIIPESARPDLAAIKEWIKRSGRLPVGVTRTEGTDKFTYKLKGTHNGEQNEAGTGTELTEDA